jgi:RNA polymerase sigma factor (sigma-70 family)
MSPAGSPDESTAGRADAASDRDLLTRFVRRQDERAFAEIVGRYGGLVLGVCRRVLSDTHSAEDAFQATFLVLARSARKIRKRRSLAAWLHGVALRVSTRALTSQKRRRERQCEAPDVTVDPLADITALYEQQMLDEQLQQLPDKYRDPLVLHYLHGQSQQQVADQLGLSVTALEGRLRRGRHELRRRLVRTGVGLGAALAAAHVASSTASAGSASLQPLIAATAKAAVAHATSQAVTALVSQEAASLA